MSDLLNDAEGRNVVIEAQRWLLRRRLSRFFKRNLVIDYNQWSVGSAEFDVGTLLGQLNVSWDDELRDLYRLLGTIGGLAYSIADTTVHVNATTGSDITGTGSAARPYATLWFLHLLPRIIAHKYRILIYTDVAVDEISISNEFKHEGCLSFIGVGAEVPVYGALDSFMAGSVTHQNVWREQTVAVAPILPVQKAFIQFTFGPSSDRAAPVCRVDPGNNRYWFHNEPIFPAGNGDTYRFVVPPVTLTINNTLSIQPVGDQTQDDALHEYFAHVVFANLIIDIQQEEVRKTVNVSGDVDVCFGFCQLSVVASPTDYPVYFSGKVNRGRPIDEDILTLSQSTVTNMFRKVLPHNDGAGLQFINPNDDSYDPTDFVLAVENNAEIRSVACMAHVEAINNVVLNCVSVKKLYINHANAQLIACCVDPNDIDSLAMLSEDTILQSSNLLFGTCTEAALLRNTRWRFGTGGGDAAATMTSIQFYAIELQGMSRVYFAIPWTGTSGSAGPPGDLVSNDPAVPWTSAFPAANSIVSDNRDNRASRGA